MELFRTAKNYGRQDRTEAHVRPVLEIQEFYSERVKIRVKYHENYTGKIGEDFIYSADPFFISSMSSTKRKTQHSFRH